MLSDAARTRKRRPRPVRTTRNALPSSAAIVALAVLFAAGEANLLANGDRAQALHQLFAAGAGLAVGIWLLRVNPGWWGWLSAFLYAAAVALLVLVDLRGYRLYGADRWLLVGSIQIQPSALAVPVAELTLACVLTSALGWGARILVGGTLLSVVVVLVAREPDLSSAVLLAGLLPIGLVAARAPLRAWAASTLGGVVVAALLLAELRPYQLARVAAFRGAPTAPEGVTYSRFEADAAIIVGGWHGVHGQLLGQVLPRYLPARETDLALASLVEQYGLGAALLCLAAVTVLVLTLGIASRQRRHARAEVLAMMAAGYVATTSVASLAGTLGWLPLAGISFPLVGAGGTAVLATVAIAVPAASRGALTTLARMAARAGDGRQRLRPRTGVRVLTAGCALLLVGAGLTCWRTASTLASRDATAAYAQAQRCQAIPAPRGSILDRHGAALAVGEQLYSLNVIPPLLLRDAVALGDVAAALHEAPAALAESLRGQNAPLVRLGDLGAPDASRLNRWTSSGVILGGSSVRDYPLGAVAGPLTGIVGRLGPQDPRLGYLPPDSVVGQSGLELEYDAVLRGFPGRVCEWVDVAGRPAAVADVAPPIPGGQVRTAIDSGLQSAMTAALAGAVGRNVKGFRPPLGAAVVLDPNSGELLALGSWPAFDPNVYSHPGRLAGYHLDGSGSPLLEHAIAIQMPPGSTFKLVVAAADVVSRAIPPEQTIPTGYTVSVGGYSLHGWGPLPPQNLVQAIAWSNDVYFYKLAMALGGDAIVQTARALNVGRPTGVDLPGEASGVIVSPTEASAQNVPWYPVTTAIMGIGQGYVAATPLQVAVWTSAVATGRLSTPHLALSTSSGSGEQALAWPAPQPLPFAAALGPIQQGLRMAVTGGTATALTAPAALGGKTGTAEDPSQPGGVDAWFTSTGPMGASDGAATVTVCLPGGGEGGDAALPVANAVWSYLLPHRAALYASDPVQPRIANAALSAGV